MVELNWLRHFYFVAREGGFTRGARAMHVAQPAVSRAIRLLEDELGFALFDRRGRTVVLTKRGGDVYRSAQVIFDQLAVVEGFVAGREAALGGPLALGVTESLASTMMPQVVQRLREDHPALVVSFAASTASDLCQKVRAGDLDACLVFHAPRIAAELHTEQEYPIRHRLVIGARWRRDARVRASFIGSREIDDSSSKAFPTLERIRRDYPSASIVVSTNSLSAHKRMVLLGAGVSVLPEFMVKNELRSGSLHSLYPRERFEWPLRLLVSRHRPLPSALRAAIPHIEAWIAAQ